MKKKTATTYQRIYDRILGVVVIGVILSSIITPDILKASVQAAGALTGETATSTVDVVYPVAEARKPKAVWSITATAYSSDVWQNDATPFLPANGKDYRKVFTEQGFIRCLANNDLKLGTKVRFVDLPDQVENLSTVQDDEEGDIWTVCDRMNSRYTGKKRFDFYIAVADENGKIDTKASLDEARKIAKSIGVQKNLKLEILF